MYINDEMAAEPRWGGGGWQAEGEDGMGGIALRFAHSEDIEVPLFGYPVRPRHQHFTPLRTTEERARSRSSESEERARLARIARRRNS
mgnify:CR=1 FL=1